tara:strand:+ start:366 stop:521 length:156 start_codon:yes stop_codon:yes gene_type:complete
VSQLHKNINTLKIQLEKEQELTKKLRKELSVARQETGNGKFWAELDEGRSS